MNPNKITIKDRLRELRGGVTQADFAKKFDVVAVTISQIENGKQNPSWELALRICEAYNCSMDWLQGRSDIQNIQQLSYDSYKEKYHEQVEKNTFLMEKIIKLQDDLLRFSYEKNASERSFKKDIERNLAVELASL
ncbi:MAG: helix-turn-helix domain-containing protein [Emticicia sp.]